MSVYNHFFSLRHFLCIFLITVLPACAESNPSGSASESSFFKKNENKKLSDFEKMLEGFPECKFNGMYVDYNTHEPKNDFFIKRKAKPIKQSSDTVYFKVNESFYGNSVKYVLLSKGFHGVVGIAFSEPVDYVRKNLDLFMKGKYSMNTIEKKRIPVLANYSDMGASSILYCSYEYDSGGELENELNDHKCLKFDEGRSKNKVDLFIKNNNIPVSSSSHYYSSAYDLNGDGKDEYFYYIESTRFCGMKTGCEIGIYSLYQENFVSISKGVPTGYLFDPSTELNNYVCLLNTYKNEWMDIEINDVVMNFNKSFYIELKSGDKK